MFDSIVLIQRVWNSLSWLSMESVPCLGCRQPDSRKCRWWGNKKTLRAVLTGYGRSAPHHHSLVRAPLVPLVPANIDYWSVARFELSTTYNIIATIGRTRKFESQGPKKSTIIEIRFIPFSKESGTSNIIISAIQYYLFGPNKIPFTSTVL